MPLIQSKIKSKISQNKILTFAVTMPKMKMMMMIKCGRSVLRLTPGLVYTNCHLSSDLH